jgi:drug/metabolite transporter (DMT)-like permease
VKPTARALPYALLTLAALCWAGNFVLARGVVGHIPPVAFAFWRWVLALALILPFTWSHLRKDWPAARTGIGSLLALSLLGISAWNALLYTAVHTTTAINAALIQSSMPAFIVVLSRGLFRDRIRRIQWAGVILGFAGAAVIVLRGKSGSLSSMAFVSGDLMLIAAVLCYALYSVLLRKRPPIHPLSFLALTFALGAAGLLPAYLLELTRTGPFVLTRETALSILYVALFPSIVAYFCWNRGVAGVGANRAGLFMNLIPVFASALSIAFLGETLQAFHLAGMALILCGMGIFYLR